MWVVTCNYNLYDQQGDYLKAAFLEKPTAAKLAKIFGLSVKDSQQLKDGKLEISKGYTWLYLVEVKDGERYIDQP